MSGPRPTLAFVLESDEVGGAELTVATMAEGVADEWQPVTILSADAPRETHRHFHEAGAPIDTVRGLRRHCTPVGLLRLLRTLRSIKPALVHVSCTDQGGGLGPLVAARLLRLPTVATLHLVSPGRRRWRELLSGWALRGPDAVICVSRSVGEYAASQGASARVVLNGIAAPRPYPNARERLGLRPDSLVVGGLGRLHHQKGWDVLCAAASMIAGRFPGVELVVVGDGPEAAALARLPECGGVRFAGPVEDAARLAGAFDVLAVPSRWEGFGRVAVEGMLAGVPVVASDVGGLPEVVGDAGLLVPVDDGEALAAALSRLLEDAALREELGERGRRRAQQRFSSERMVEEVRVVYRTVLDARRPLRS